MLADKLVEKHDNKNTSNKKNYRSKTIQVAGRRLQRLAIGGLLEMIRGSFSLFDMDSIIRRSGAERVGEDASMKLSEKLEDSGKEILLRANHPAG